MIDYLTANGFGPETRAGWFTAPTAAETSLMQERVDFAEANGLGRVELVGADAAMAGTASGTINLGTLAFHAPALDDHLRAEFFG